MESSLRSLVHKQPSKAWLLSVIGPPVGKQEWYPFHVYSPGVCHKSPSKQDHQHPDRKKKINKCYSQSLSQDPSALIPSNEAL